MRQVREDSPEEIRKCLSCPRAKCVNCLSPYYVPPKQKKNKRGVPVTAFGNGEELHFECVREAAAAMFVTESAIQQALRVGCRCKNYYWRYDDEH